MLRFWRTPQPHHSTQHTTHTPNHTTTHHKTHDKHTTPHNHTTTQQLQYTWGGFTNYTFGHQLLTFIVCVDRIGIGTDRVLIGVDRVLIGVDRVLNGVDRVLIGVDRVSIGVDRILIGDDRILISTDGVFIGSHINFNFIGFSFQGREFWKELKKKIQWIMNKELIILQLDCPYFLYALWLLSLPHMVQYNGSNDDLDKRIDFRYPNSICIMKYVRSRLI